MTDPTRSNSGQITLNLWLESKGIDINNPQAESLFKTIKSAVYQPPRSTDVLLQEFIARGPNDADVATVYESIALYRWQQAGVSQGKPYQIYYLNPTVETVATAAIVHRDVGTSQAKAAKTFIDFLIQTPQQETFVQYGFRPIISGINLSSVSQSPWNQNIPGSQVDLSVKTFPAPNSNTVGEIQRLWNRAN
jgi:ABC-type sulfate transport system substrate-binding protein